MAVEAQVVDNTEQKLERLVNLGDQLTQWEQGFTESVADQFKRRGRLSNGQIDVIDKILAKHDPEAIEARNEWQASYDDEKRALARKVAEYYIKNPPYYEGVARRILDDPNYVPSEKCFRKMTENKYALRALAVAATPAVFSQGQLVRFRRNSEVRSFHTEWTRHGGASSLQGKLAVILGVKEVEGNGCKGSRSYNVLPVGATQPILTLERRLMRSKTA